jgi:hypothetical protein
MITFADIYAEARAASQLTAAEFDYSLANGPGTAIGALADAAYVLATADLPLKTWADLPARHAAAEALIDATRHERTARISAAKRRTYTGWSNASRGPIRYGSVVTK